MNRKTKENPILTDSQVLFECTSTKHLPTILITCQNVPPTQIHLQKGEISKCFHFGLMIFVNKIMGIYQSLSISTLCILYHSPLASYLLQDREAANFVWYSFPLVKDWQIVLNLTTRKSSEAINLYFQFNATSQNVLKS